MNKRYTDLFQARENLLYHISWSKADGNYEEARRMRTELDNVDRALDALEEVVNVLI